MLLKRSPEMNEANELPIVSVIIIADKNKCPQGFVPITKTFDDNSDADLWKEGFSFGIFNRTVRYLAYSKEVSNKLIGGNLEVLTDLMVVGEKDAVPYTYVSIDCTVDTRETALRKKYICARFTSRNDALDAISDIIVLAKAKRPPKGYTIAGEIDGMTIAIKAIVIPEDYGRLSHSQSDRMFSKNLYPGIDGASTNNNTGLRHSMNNIANQTSHSADSFGIQRIPFKLSPAVAIFTTSSKSELPGFPEEKPLDKYRYDFNLERSILRQTS